MKKIFFALVFTITYFFSCAQMPLNLVTVDRETYSLWQQKDWDALISVGKKALKAGIDFHYLRVRMGIAYYEKGNYHAAIQNFQIAYKQHSNENYLKEYLYFSYLFAGRQMDAKVLASTFSHDLKQKLGAADGKKINSTEFFYSISQYPNDNVADDFSINVDLQKNGFQDITKNMGILSVGLWHSLNPKFSIHHSYSNIQKKSFLYYQKDGFSNTYLDSKTNLHQYYISANTRVSTGLNILFGGHYIYLLFPYEVTVVGQGQPYQTTNYVKRNDFVTFISGYKRLKYFTVGSSVYYSGLSSSTQMQGDISVATYPLGNLNLYTFSTLSFQREWYSKSSYNDRVVLDQLIGVKATKFMWIEGFATLGDMHSFVRNDGLSVYNGAQVIKRRLGVRLFFVINPKINLSITYANFIQESSFIENHDLNLSNNIIKYSNHSLTGGLIWNF
jgi:hypothetical protein